MWFQLLQKPKPLLREGQRENIGVFAFDLRVPGATLMPIGLSTFIIKAFCESDSAAPNQVVKTIKLFCGFFVALDHIA